MIHIWSFYGLFGAPWPRGCGFSTGVDVLAGKIGRRFGATVHNTRTWSDWEDVASDILDLPDSDRVVLLGHSYGAYSCTAIADALKHLRDIDAILSFDASIFPPGCPLPINDNVKHALSIKGLGPSIPGHCPLSPADGCTPHIEYDTTYLLHEAIDDSPDLHELALRFLDHVLR